jgi:hypothetical protein
MAGVRPVEAARRGRRIDVDPPLGLLAGEREQVDAEIGADHRETAGAILDVAGRGLERLGGEVLGTLHGAARRRPSPPSRR